MNANSTVDLIDWKASSEEQAPEVYPHLHNLSAAFVYRFIARPAKVAPPEFLYVPFLSKGRRLVEMTGIMGTWNLGWEQAQLRSEVSLLRKEWMQEDYSLPALDVLKNRNVYLLPNTKKRFDAYLPLYAMLPINILQRFGLPLSVACFGQRLCRKIVGRLSRICRLIFVSAYPEHLLLLSGL